ncbi:hypothetical protein [Tahibacter sp.]|uniref:hypothetical protein n=1 Tax=Tahibacter sp. TaxID=2056211 RepID=UPI0028C4BA02|nr:hypothetical protein [Tahibacter sp.]
MKRPLLLLFCLLFSACSWAQQPTTFVFVKVAESILPIARGNKYEDPLDAALKAEGLGAVTGGGTSLSKDKDIDWVGVDVELTDVTKGVPFLRKKLIEFGAPKGSTLEYELDGKRIELPVHEGGGQ